MEPQIIHLGMTVDQYISTLLDRFRQCNNYSDKLALWEENGLTERLFYNIYAEDKASVFAFATWEDVKKMPILTLTPFTHEEAEQFTEWALRVRSRINKHVSTFEQRRDFVISQYKKCPSSADKQFFLDNYRQQIDNMKQAIFEIGGLDYPLVERLVQIDVSHYMEMIMLLRLGESVPLAHWIWQAENLAEPHRMNWKLIDTYLLAEGVIQTSVFLEQFNPNDNQSQSEASSNHKETPKKNKQFAFASDFGDYIIPECRDKLKPFLIEQYTGQKPKQFGYMLFALETLELLIKNSLDAQTELHKALTSTFGNVGARQRIQQLISDLRNASSTEELQIRIHMDRISAFIWSE